MLYALDENGNKIRPMSEGQLAKDPFTGGLVCGKLDTVNYWRLIDEKYDSWALPSASSWSLNWKLKFPKEMVENTITKGNEKHIADIEASKGTIFKLQRRMLKEKELASRELFFEKMVWIFDASKWDFNLQFETTHYVTNNGRPRKLPTPPPNTYEWIGFGCRYPKMAFKKSKMPIFLDFGDDNIYWFNWQLHSQINCRFYPAAGVMKAYNKDDFIKKYTQ